MLFSLQVPPPFLKLYLLMHRYLPILLLVLFACSTPSPKTRVLRLAFQAMPATLDPRSSGDFVSATLICLIYEGLTRCLPDGGVEPALAHKIDISPDSCIYTFHLRKAFWTDGRPVTATDFEQSWKKIADPTFPSPCSYLFFPIKNGEKCTKGEIPLSSLGVQALDPYTLRVELERPTPYFLSLTALPLFLPVPSHVEKISINQPVCNGPFQIETLIPDSEILLRKNPGFWNAQQLPLDAIRISIIGDENTALQLFERGELDWLGAPLSPIPPDAVPMLQAKGEIHSLPMDASTFIAFNTKAAPFQNRHLRKALSLALDRERIIGELDLTGQIPAKRFLPPTLTDSSRPSLLAYDPGAALRYFEQALTELDLLSSDLESLTLYYKTGQTQKRLAQVLQREWKEKLGFTIRIEQIDPQTHMEKLHRRDYQIALACWIAQFHDPVNILERYRLPSNPKNFAEWEDDQYAGLLERASSTSDERQRLELLSIAEEIFADALPISPLYHWTSPSLSNPRLKNSAATPEGCPLFERFEFREAI